MTTSGSTLGALLFVREARDVPCALEAARVMRAPELLGVCVRDRLDDALPLPSLESYTLDGVWSLCRFELPPELGIASEDRRRDYLAAALELEALDRIIP